MDRVREHTQQPICGVCHASILQITRVYTCGQLNCKHSTRVYTCVYVWILYIGRQWTIELQKQYTCVHVCIRVDTIHRSTVDNRITNTVHVCIRVDIIHRSTTYQRRLGQCRGPQLVKSLEKTILFRCYFICIMPSNHA